MNRGPGAVLLFHWIDNGVNLRIRITDAAGKTIPYEDHLLVRCPPPATPEQFFRLMPGHGFSRGPIRLKGIRLRGKAPYMASARFEGMYYAEDAVFPMKPWSGVLESNQVALKR